MSNIISDKNLRLDTKTCAFPYQAEAFNFVKDLNYSAIFHEQGLGKTKIALDLTLYWLNKRDIDCVMIVTKKQLVFNWIGEIENHTYLKAKTIDSNRGHNYMVLNSPTKIIVTNFETIESEMDRIKIFLKTRNVAIIIDESTKIKNPQSKLTQCFFELADLFRIKTIMTGTPVANRPYDVWAQIYFLDHGRALGNDFNEFKHNTDLSNRLEKDESAQREFEDNVGSIYNRIAYFSVRETKKTAGIQLPQKKYITVNAKFESHQEKLYRQIVRNLSIEIKKDGEKILDDDSEALKRLLRLNQVTSNPRLLDDDYLMCSGKEMALSELLEEISNRGEKCIVWSCFIENINEFTEKYAKYNPRKIHGKMSIDERNKSIEKFKNDNNCRVLFATPQAAKEGLTLTVANNVIFYDRTFNLDDYLQAQDRIHRISQKKDCIIYNIIINESIDKWIEALLTAKQYAAYLAQGDITINKYKKIADYSYGEIIKSILMEDRKDG